MPETDIHPAHAANKLEQAIRIGDWLRDNGGKFSTAEGMRQVTTDTSWDLISQMAGEVRTPSEATRAMIVRYMRLEEAKEAKAFAKLEAKLIEAAGRLRCPPELVFAILA